MRRPRGVDPPPAKGCPGFTFAHGKERATTGAGACTPRMPRHREFRLQRKANPAMLALRATLRRTALGRSALGRSEPLPGMCVNVARVPHGVCAPLARVLSSQPSYVERQQAKGRPISPHLTIYRFPIAAVSSITTRITGCALMVGTSGIGALALVGDVGATVDAFVAAAPGAVPLAKFAVAFPLSYHYLSAVRHAVRARVRSSARARRGVGMGFSSQGSPREVRGSRPLTLVSSAPRAPGHGPPRSTGT